MLLKLTAGVVARISGRNTRGSGLAGSQPAPEKAACPSEDQLPLAWKHAHASCHELGHTCGEHKMMNLGKEHGGILGKLFGLQTSERLEKIK